jgi:hypothetical protein
MRKLEVGAATLSMAAGLIHLSAGPDHFDEWWVYGVFFYGAAAAQAGYAIILFSQGIQGWGGWNVVRRHFYGLGVAGNIAIIGLWLVTRLVAIPVGPEAGEREPFGWLDLMSKAIEIPLVVLLMILVAKTPARKAKDGGHSA